MLFELAIAALLALDGYLLLLTRRVEALPANAGHAEPWLKG